MRINGRRKMNVWINGEREYGQKSHEQTPGWWTNWKCYIREAGNSLRKILIASAAISLHSFRSSEEKRFIRSGISTIIGERSFSYALYSSFRLKLYSIHFENKMPYSYSGSSTHCYVYNFVTFQHLLHLHLIVTGHLDNITLTFFSLLLPS